MLRVAASASARSSTHHQIAPVAATVTSATRTVEAASASSTALGDTTARPWVGSAPASQTLAASYVESAIPATTATLIVFVSVGCMINIKLWIN